MSGASGTDPEAGEESAWVTDSQANDGTARSVVEVVAEELGPSLTGAPLGVALV